MMNDLISRKYQMKLVKSVEQALWDENITNGLSLETTKEVMGDADIKQMQYYGKILHIKMSQDTGKNGRNKG
jgi:hypothetical protein